MKIACFVGNTTAKSSTLDQSSVNSRSESVENITYRSPSRSELAAICSPGSMQPASKCFPWKPYGESAGHPEPRPLSIRLLIFFLF
jgi:hypothetical protein